MGTSLERYPTRRFGTKLYQRRNWFSNLRDARTEADWIKKHEDVSGVRIVRSTSRGRFGGAYVYSRPAKWDKE